MTHTQTERKKVIMHTPKWQLQGPIWFYDGIVDTQENVWWVYSRCLPGTFTRENYGCRLRRPEQAVTGFPGVEQFWSFRRT